MARKLSTAQQEYSLTQLGGAENGTLDTAQGAGPAGFLEFCENLDELPTPPPDMIRRDSTGSNGTPPSPRSSTPLKDKKESRKSHFFGFKKEKS
jgi:hypothetical protein